MTPQSSWIRGREAASTRGPAQVGFELRDCAAREARRIAEMERLAWRAARDRCLQLEKIRRNARRRLDELASAAADSPEKFTGERALAEAALREVARCEPHDSAAYTILSFAARRDRLRYLRGSDADREAMVRETVARGGVRDDRGHFQEIVR